MNWFEFFIWIVFSISLYFFVKWIFLSTIIYYMAHVIQQANKKSQMACLIAIEIINSMKMIKTQGHFIRVFNPKEIITEKQLFLQFIFKNSQRKINFKLKK